MLDQARCENGASAGDVHDPRATAKSDMHGMQENAGRREPGKPSFGTTSLADPKIAMAEHSNEQKERP